MLDIETQLDRLKQRVAAIDRAYAGKYARKDNARVAAAPVAKQDRARSFIEQWAEGSVVANEFGEHFQTERLFSALKQHGSADIGALNELPAGLLDALSDNEIADVAPARWAFLDTETTGLAGGSGTYAFLIGVGRITPEGFRVRQFFMRDYVEEKSVLAALEAHLSEFDVMITYNGKTYDQPLLETRYRMCRHKAPFSRIRHLDLLFGARRLWKLRLETCRLVQLEQQILGVFREGDLPGELIPYVYFEYLRGREAQRLVPVFHHNAMDILTLACLTAVVPAAFRTADADALRQVGVRRGEDLIGIARWLLNAGETEKPLHLFKRALDLGLPDKLLFRALWDVAALEKKLARPAAALQIYTELAGCRNDHRVGALEELAKHYEHGEKNYGVALEFTRQALGFERTDSLVKRKERLERRLARPRTRNLMEGTLAR
jgi:uncharacterized protein YprB with RNaseH-like and TPR domain